MLRVMLSVLILVLVEMSLKCDVFPSDHPEDMS